MIQLSKQPYQRKYAFGFMSLTNCFRAFLFILAILLPFFIVFSIPYFYQASKPIYYRPSFTLNSNYYVLLSTSKVSSSNAIQHQDYRYTNFQSTQSDADSQTAFVSKSPPLDLQIIQQSDNFTLIRLTLTKDLTAISAVNGYRKVNKVFAMIGIQYSFGGTTSNGVAVCQSSGYDLAEVGFSGRLIMKKGHNVTQYPSSTLQLFSANQFDTGALLRATQKQASFLKYQYSDLPLSYPSSRFTESTFIYDDQQISIFGQFIWSWVQYCPIAVCFLWIANQILKFLMRQGILKRTVIEDPDWLKATQNKKLY